jgi:tRNA 2-thiouridine synthesizing protein A
MSISSLSELRLVDARGLSCPMPLLKAKLALNQCAIGEQVTVLATDAGSVRDFHSFVELSVHTLVLFTPHNSAPNPYFEYILQKGPSL